MKFLQRFFIPHCVNKRKKYIHEKSRKNCVPLKYLQELLHLCEVIQKHWRIHFNHLIACSKWKADVHTTTRCTLHFRKLENLAFQICMGSEDRVMTWVGKPFLEKYESSIPILKTKCNDETKEDVNLDVRAAPKVTFMFGG